tara:strand:+ start:956 stop:1390 length:435 start_codon:yes stop_codon:yes gene_type:complete
MATINATINITSDISSYPTRINNTMTMTKAGGCTGLDETTGLRSKKFTSTAVGIIVEADEITADQASKLYIRNTGSSKENFFYIAYNSGAAAAATAETIGKLYGGDWMLMPYDGGTDITVASSTTDTQILEYMVFADGIVEAKG